MNLPTEIAIEVVKDYGEYLDRVSSSPYSYFYLLTKDENGLEEISFAKWIVSEILCLLKQNNDIPPLVTIEKLRKKICAYSRLNNRTSYIFSIACDAIDDIVHMLITM